MVADGRRRPRPAAEQARRRRRGAQGRTRGPRIARQRQADRRLARRRPAADDPVLPLLRRLGRQDPRQDDPRRRQRTSATPGTSRSASSGRSSRGTSRCSCRRGSGGRPWRAATPSCSSRPSRRRSRPCAWRNWRRRSASPTASSTSCPATARPPGRRSSGHMDVDKIAFTGETGTGKIVMTAAAQSQPEARQPRTRRQVAEHRLRRRRPRRRGGRGVLRAVLQPGAVLLRRAAGCSCEETVYDEFVAEDRREGEGPQGRRPVRPGRPSRGRR